MNEGLTRFIQSSFRSIWSLEVLLLLRSERRSWARDELVSTLRASDLVVSKALDSLLAAGLVTMNDDGLAAYAPVNEDVATHVDQLQPLYRQRPDMIRRLIIASSAPGLAAFSDAFKLGK